MQLIALLSKVRLSRVSLRSNRIFYTVALAFVLLGASIAIELRTFPPSDVYKILNVGGIFYGIIGVVVLSELVLENERWQEFIVNTLAGLTVWAQILIPLGAVLANLAMAFIPSKFPFAPVFLHRAWTLFTWSMIFAVVVGELVFSPSAWVSKNPVKRARVLGLSMVLVGMVCQLLTASHDTFGYPP